MGEVSFSDIEAARAHLRGVAHVTPVMCSRLLDEAAGAEVFLKCENFQRSGAFKFRGAYNALSRLAAGVRKNGVVTYSSGNHGQALALAGQLLGIRVAVVMPDDSSPVKRAACVAYGAEVVVCAAASDQRRATASKLAQERGATLIPPFDHRDVIAGQGTAALELLEATGGLDAVIVPCGGGGLMGGTAVAVKGHSQSCRVIGVEPSAGDDAVRSFRSGRLESVSSPQTIADGARTQALGKLNFALMRELVDDMTSVTDESIKETVRWLFSRMKIVVEPTGVMGVAALLGRQVAVKGRVGIILSGGNVDPAVMAEILRGAN